MERLCCALSIHDFQRIQLIMSGLEEATEFRRLLRSGWRQISDCPNKCSALLLEKEGEVFCHRCQEWFPDHPIPASASGNSGLKSLKDSALFQQLQTQMMDHSQAQTAQASQKAESGNLDSVSELLGKRMLAGWTLLAQHCSRCECPLMRKGDEEICVNCLENPTSSSSATQATGGDPRALGSEEDVKDDELPLDKFYEKTSALQEGNDQQLADTMGEHLLKGWTLLGFACPNCNVPLLRDREGQMWCIKCNLRVVHEQDVEDPPKKAAGHVLSPKQRPPKTLSETFHAGGSSGVVSQPKSVSQSKPISPPRSAARSLYFGETPRVTSHTPGRKRRRSIVVLDDVKHQEEEESDSRVQSDFPDSLRRRQADVQSSTIVALFSKLEYFQKVLTDTSDPEACIKIAQSIAELARTVAIVKHQL